jgi:chromosome segregation ATPase
MTDRPPNTPLALRQRMMPSNRTAEHARHVLDRVTRGVTIPASVYRHLVNLANSLEAGKSELKGHLSDRNAQIRHLKHELEKAHALQSDDGLIQLYNAGGKLISKQADEIKDLKRELQRGKDERDRLVPKLVERDKQIAKVEEEKKNCREAMRRLQDRLAGLELGSPDSQVDPNRELAILKQRLEEYRKVAEDQKEHIQRLTKENDRLVMALGRQHFNEMDLP